MNFLRRQNMPFILKATSDVCGLLSACDVPGAGIVQVAADFYSDYVEQNQLKSMVGEFSDMGKSGFEQLNKSMSGQLSGNQLGQN
jgi:hypothetical protein